MAFGIILWLIIGGLAGGLARQITGHYGPYGMPGDIIIGLLGALVGGFTLNFLGLPTAGPLYSVVTATAGAVFLLWLFHRFKTVD